MNPLILVLALVTKPSSASDDDGDVRGKFHLGRLLPPSSPGLLDLSLSSPGLPNGFLRPADAARACDRHPECAGFTYRGLRDTSKFPDKK